MAKHLTELPEYKRPPAGWPGNADDVMGRHPAGEVWWSNEVDPPAVGDEVVVSVNGIGPGKVIGYFVEADFLGVKVIPHVKPKWWEPAKPGEPPLFCMVFGAELKL